MLGPTHRTWPALSVALLATALVTLTPTGASGAAGGLKYVPSPAKATSSGMTALPVAMCPGNRHAIGGGVRAAGGFARHELTSSGPASKGGDPDDVPDGWGGGTRNLTQPGTKPLTARSWAICTKGYVDVLASTPGDVNPGDVRWSSIGICTGEWHVTSGGVSTAGGEPGGVQRVSQSYPVPDHAWSAAMHNLGAFPTTMHISVLCAKGSYSYVSKAKSIGPEQQARVQKRCPPDTRVVGGGAYVTGDKSTFHLSASFPRDVDGDTVPDDAWRVDANNLDTANRTMIVTAICRG